MRPKSTGFRSENSHVLGHTRDILSQLQMDPRQIMQVLYAILEIDAEGLDDWPRAAGKSKPWSKATGEDAALAIERAHHFADYYGMWLHEYFGSEAVRVYYGEGT